MNFHNPKQAENSTNMDGHFKHGIELPPISIIPYGKTFDDLHINDQRLILATLRQQQILQMQGQKVALLCMGKVSLYDTYEEAAVVKESCPYIDSTIFFPKGYTGRKPSNSPISGVYAISYTTILP